MGSDIYAQNHNRTINLKVNMSFRFFYFFIVESKQKGSEIVEYLDRACV